MTNGIRVDKPVLPNSKNSNTKSNAIEVRKGISLHTKQSALEKGIDTISQGMEKQFAYQMLQEMRKTIQKEKPEGSELDYYNSLLDQERAQIMVEHQGGLGLQKLIKDQLMPKYQNHIPRRQAIKTFTQASGIPVKEPLAKETSNE